MWERIRLSHPTNIIRNNTPSPVGEGRGEGGLEDRRVGGLEDRLFNVNGLPSKLLIFLPS